ncbi:hypothetical protein ACIP5Y_13580 [Nocardia sp. NPDC088792]|uniref:hypothetical protein n=1 Tax=Nocardia sp. NPDC088792 TaxID=3364332 RepID=UPI003820A80B
MAGGESRSWETWLKELTAQAEAAGLSLRRKHEAPYGWELVRDDETVEWGSLVDIERYLQSGHSPD